MRAQNVSTYYDILGVHPQAGTTEIKVAFRRLAKIYHPDKNPRDKELFTSILKAYEILSNPVLKNAYDRKLRYNQPEAGSPHKAQSKNWRFDEREIRRRKYYDEHIRQYEKAKYHNQTPKAEKKSYNDFKYILFATPLAVALFLLIVRLAVPDKRDSLSKKDNTVALNVPAVKPEVLEGPYTLFFGGARFDTRRPDELVLKNNNGTELIACLFGKNGFIRSVYLPQNASATIQYLPDEPIELRCFYGTGFDDTALIPTLDIVGSFKTTLGYYKSLHVFYRDENNEVLLKAEANSNFTRINEKEFFTRN